MEKDLLQAIGELIDTKLEAKLEPIISEIHSIKNDLSVVKVRVDSINNRLYKLEDRMTKVDAKIDKLLFTT